MYALEVTDISKAFSGFRVLKGISLTLRPGEVRALVGENGAGKSTLMRILAGVEVPDAGTIEVEGAQQQYTHPLHAYEAGVSTVFQELNLLPDRSVAQNIWLGREPRKRGFLDIRKMNRDTEELLASLGVDSITPGDMCGELSVAQQQMVEIAKAMSYRPRVVSMDEPTAALADHEAQLLFDLVERLRSDGVAVLYVSHRMKEIFELCDSVTIMRDGVVTADGSISDFSPEQVVDLMVGRAIEAYFPDKPDLQANLDAVPRFELSGAGNEEVDGVDLQVWPGEIVGIAGLQGAGRTELLMSIYGRTPFTRGTMRLDGKTVHPRSARQGIRVGLSLVTEDRKRTGLALQQSITDNALSIVRAVPKPETRRSVSRMADMFRSMGLMARALSQEVRLLSGGNQQKVVLAKCLLTRPRLLLADEPTRGVDVGARVAIYNTLRELTESGSSVLMASSELPELIGVADRIVVMHEGRVVAHLPGDASESEILAHCTAVA